MSIPPPMEGFTLLAWLHMRLTPLTRAKCGVRSTLCWKIPNVSGSIELFAL